MREFVVVAGLTLAFASGAARADHYVITPASGDLVGTEASAVTRHEDTLIDIARANGLGYEEIVNANPDVDPWLPGAGVNVELPKHRILPMAPHRGIVINLPEHRLYYYPPARDGQEQQVYSFPVSIGRMDWRTPIGTTRIVQKIRNPVWYVPKTIRDEHALKGDILPAVVPAGPDNPLGLFALRLGIPGGAYLIHGTNKPAGVGMQVTHGCMRLYPEDIEALFGMVPVNTTVTIVNQPFKAGWQDGRLWVEVHPALREDVVDPPTLTELTHLVVEATRDRLVPIDWAAVQRAFAEARGMAVPVTVPVPAAAVAATANDD